ncbi:MAG: sigma-54-dependent Fis family transcriptional regulator [Clostridia bacterium]|jgi:arginine utilization regulatory protein|nr:sigma-54-dependent Fis family transcriptional regulator [Clostridia bacterium]
MNYKRLLELILVNLDEGIIVTDSMANITFYKEPATNIGGIEAKMAIGMNILEVFPDLTPETSTFYSVIKSKRPLIEHIQHYTNYEGKKVSTVTSTIPIIENNELVGCFEIFKDLTQVMDLSEKVVRLQEQLYKKNHNEKSNENSSEASYTFENIIGKSVGLLELKKKARMIANSSSPVLIYGETGTGKELFIQAIHNASSRRSKPFIAQNCAALPFNLLESILFGTSSGSFTGAKDNPGLFELADGGTLFLDEINSLELDLQAKLLRVLQDGVVRRVGANKTKKVDVRIMASTNEDPVRLVQKKHLREDLYYRLNVIYLEIPPLRERKEDIKSLVDYFIDKYNKALGKNISGISHEIEEVLQAYYWPGNIRELEHVIESAMNFAFGHKIFLEDISYNFRKPLTQRAYVHMGEEAKAFDLDLNQEVEGYELQLIKKAIRAAEGNCTKAAKLLKIPKQTLHNKLKKYDIKLVKDIK